MVCHFVKSTSSNIFVNKLLVFSNWFAATTKRFQEESLGKGSGMILEEMMAERL